MQLVYGIITTQANGETLTRMQTIQWGRSSLAPQSKHTQFKEQVLKHICMHMSGHKAGGKEEMMGVTRGGAGSAGGKTAVGKEVGPRKKSILDRHCAQHGRSRRTQPGASPPLRLRVLVGCAGSWGVLVGLARGGGGRPAGPEGGRRALRLSRRQGSRRARRPPGWQRWWPGAVQWQRWRQRYPCAASGARRGSTWPRCWEPPGGQGGKGGGGAVP